MNEPASILRAAAVRVREVATAATKPPWWDSPVLAAPGHHTIRGGDDDWRGFDGSLPGDVRPIARIEPAPDDEGALVNHPDADAAHIALWHPGVALAVADWLDAEAAKIDSDESAAIAWHYVAALAVARALLPEEVDHG